MTYHLLYLNIYKALFHQASDDIRTAFWRHPYVNIWKQTPLHRSNPANSLGRWPVLLLEFYFTAEFSLNANTADGDIDSVRSGVAD